ncbi:MAG: universal stress protein [Aquificae bacterium]|nr:universal stress protein [Aquificota bacterium]
MRQQSLPPEGFEGKEEFKIALGYDPEDDPSPLFEYTFHLARLLGGSVVVVHALETVLSTQTEEEERELLKRIEEVLKSLDLPEVPTEVEILYGKNLETFLQFVEKRSVDLFAFYFFKKLFGKTLAEEFMEGLPCGLFVVKEGVPFREIRRILVPLDFSESSFRQKELVERIKAFSPYEVEFTFLHVLEEENEGEEQEVRMLFGELFDGFGELKIRWGDPAEEILKELSENDYQLVVVGRTGKGLNLDYGNVTKEVVEEAPCPVVVV